MKQKNIVDVLLVGYGNMGKEWARILEDFDRTHLVAVADPLEANRAQAVSDYDLDEACVSASLETLLGHLKPDLIIDCSPPPAHAQNTQIALTNNSHILGEKPIALHIEEAQQIVEVAAATSNIYKVNQNYRYHPMFQALRAYFNSRPLGKITSIDIEYTQRFSFNDTFRYKMPHPLLTDMAVHHFDLVRCLIGGQYSSVFCREFNPSNSPFIAGSSASAIFEMAGGVLFNYRGSWSDFSDNKSFIGRWRIACEQGTIVWDGVNNPMIISPENPEGHVLHLLDAGSYAAQTIFSQELQASLEDMLAAIDANGQPETWCGDNIHTLDMVLGAIKSAESNRVVQAG